MAGLQGRVFGGYQLTHYIGSGSVAEVYRATASKPGGREVVVKVIHPEFARQPGFLPNFRRITEFSAKLANHPHILPLLASGEQSGYLYLVTPYVASGTLRDSLQAGTRLNASDVGPFFRQLCGALAYAHSLGIVHGNLKPSNVYLFEGRHVLLGDFGLLWDVQHIDMEHTGSGTEVVEYLAPEAFSGQTSQPGDIYSLGAILFATLAGRPPFQGKKPADVYAAHIQQYVPRLVEVDAALPAAVQALDTVVQRAMAKRAEDRFPSAMALAQALEGTLGQALATSPTQSPPPTVGAPQGWGSDGGAFTPGAQAPAHVAVPPPFPPAPGIAGGAGALAAGMIAPGLAQLNPPFPPLPSSAEVDESMESGRIPVPPQFLDVAGQSTVRTPAADLGVGGIAPTEYPQTMRIPAPPGQGNGFSAPFPPPAPFGSGGFGEPAAGGYPPSDSAGLASFPPPILPAAHTPPSGWGQGTNGSVEDAPLGDDRFDDGRFGGRSHVGAGLSGEFSVAGGAQTAGREWGFAGDSPAGAEGNGLHSPPGWESSELPAFNQGFDQGFDQGSDQELNQGQGMPAVRLEQERDVSHAMGFEAAPEMRGYGAPSMPSVPPRAAGGRHETFSPTELGLPRLTTPELRGLPQGWDAGEPPMEAAAYGGAEIVWGQQRPPAAYPSQPQHAPMSHPLSGGWTVAGGNEQPGQGWATSSAGAQVASGARDGRRRRGRAATAAPQPEGDPHGYATGSPYSAMDDSFAEQRVWTVGGTALRPRRRHGRRQLIGSLILLLLCELGYVVLARPDLCPTSACATVGTSISQLARQYIHIGGASAAGLEASPATLAMQVPGEGTASSSVRITNGGGESVGWQAKSNLPWLTVTPANGTLNAKGSLTLTITARPLGIAKGTYPAVITVSSGAQTTTVPVKVTVGIGPQLAVSPPTLTFTNCETAKPIVLKNTGGSTLSYSLSPSQSKVLTVSATGGALDPGASQTVNVTLTCSAQYGANYAVIVVSTGGSTQVNVHYGN